MKTMILAPCAALILTALGASAPLQAAAPRIPLCPGLTVVTAVSQPAGDYESIKTIQTVTDSEVRLAYSAEVMNNDMLADGPALKKLNLHRVMLVNDLQSATDYQQIYLDKSEEKIPGATSIGTSSAVLQNLKTKGKSDFGYSNAYSDLALSAEKAKYPNYYSYFQRGTIERVAGAATLAVIVNDVAVDLPVIRAQGDFYGDKVEFLFSDDPANPLTLSFRIGIDAIKPHTPEQAEYCAALTKSGGGEVPTVPLMGGLRCDKPKGADRDVLRVVKIAYHCGSMPPSGGGGGSGPPAGLGAGDLKVGDGGGALEKALASQQKVDIYSIYFSFNSDAIRDESTTTLKEIADIMTRHPDWRLAVNGHTDGIGGDTANMDLSKRRAAAVVNALVTRYHIDAGRLKSAGFGKSQPKDTNDTLEGRARNRRVELMRF